MTHVTFFLQKDVAPGERVGRVSNVSAKENWQSLAISTSTVPLEEFSAGTGGHLKTRASLLQASFPQSFTICSGSATADDASKEQGGLQERAPGVSPRPRDQEE